MERNTNRTIRRIVWLAALAVSITFFALTGRIGYVVISVILFAFSIIYLLRRIIKGEPLTRPEVEGKGLLLRWEEHTTCYLVIKEETDEGKETNPYADNYDRPVVICDFIYKEEKDIVVFNCLHEIMRGAYYVVKRPEEQDRVMKRVEAERKSLGSKP